MKDHIAVVAWTAENRIAKYQDFEDRAAADAHVLQVAARFPGAFAAARPNGPFQDWLIDPVAETLTILPADPPAKQLPTDTAVLEQALRDKGTLSQGDLDAARAKLS